METEATTTFLATLWQDLKHPELEMERRVGKAAKLGTTRKNNKVDSEECGQLKKDGNHLTMEGKDTNAWEATT